MIFLQIISLRNKYKIIRAVEWGFIVLLCMRRNQLSCNVILNLVVAHKKSMKNILVLCTGNSCRSQMAEGYLRYFAKDKANIYSAGIETHGVNSKAVQVMKEDGIDISA